jgi:hypothetical protein
MLMTDRRSIFSGKLSFRNVVQFLLLLVFSASGTILCAQIVTIKLVNGRNGRPMVGASSYVNVWVGTERKEAIAIPTDGNGVARLHLTLNTSEINIPKLSKDFRSIVAANPIVEFKESFAINVPYALCVSGGSNYSWLMLQHLSTKEILDRGFVSPNTCGRATVTPKPGQVILFVRPLTFWEQLKE